MAKINKDEIVEFANNHYKDNHVVVYKRTKDNPNLNKIDKPPVTPIAVNRDEKSRFFMNLKKLR